MKKIKVLDDLSEKIFQSSLVRKILNTIKKPYVITRKLIHRAKHGWCYEDTWNLDAYLSKIIYESISYLRKTQTGHPSNITEKEWHDKLDIIIEAYKLQYEISSSNKHKYFDDMPKEKRKKLNCITREQQRILNKGQKLFITEFDNFWD